MAGKSRVPMQVSPEFELRIKKLQSQIMKQEGKIVSLRDITEKLSKDPNFEEIEKSILRIANSELKVNFDSRRKR